MRFARVLAPVDFSDDSRNAAALALALTDPAGELTILHVDPLPDLAEPHGRGILHALGEHLRARFTVQLGELLAELCPGGGPATATVRGESRSGEPAEVICVVASTWPADIIVMGSHGESGSVRFLFGSVTTKVTRTAPCPVLVTRPGHAARVAAAGALRRALLAVDYSPFSVPAAELAARMMAPGGELVLMHVWHSPGNLPLPFTGDRRAADEDKLERFAAGLDLHGVDTDLIIGVGNPAAQLLDQAARMEADLIAVGAHGGDGMVDQVLGTVAERILRHADAPVLLVPERAMH